MDIVRRMFGLQRQDPPPSSISPSSTTAVAMESQGKAMASPFLDLPSEILHQVLAHLPPLSLLRLSATCRSLRRHAEDELLWAKYVQENLPYSAPSFTPCKSWRDLYASLHPYWFLPKYKFWYSDKATTGSELVGQLIVARYDHRIGSIEAYRLVAEFGPDSHSVEQWELNSDVIVHRFNPNIQLFLDNPVVKLDHDAPRGHRLQEEIAMPTEADRRVQVIRSQLFLTKAISEQLQVPNMNLWPPNLLPAKNRVRNESANLFRGAGHKPATFDEVSDTTFRMRKWMEFRGIRGDRVRIGEDVMTFSTLPPESYTPTKDKPYQGIWVGDYGGHGCEFLLLLQKTAKEARDIPRIQPGSLAPWFPADFAVAHTNGNPSFTLPEGVIPPPLEDDSELEGRIEAIKLTGDPNVPRGEYTWIAEDISRQSLIRIAHENIFRGARVVKSWGHIAAHDFRDDKYVPAQLIMISHDFLAQYWENMGHISFYKRIDFDKLLNVRELAEDTK